MTQCKYYKLTGGQCLRTASQGSKYCCSHQKCEQPITYPKSNSPEGDKIFFFNRAKGTIIDKKYGILFNLFLVKNNVRTAFLLEVANYPHVDSTELFDTVKNTYTEFHYTVENKINDRVHRVFFHTKYLIKKKNVHDIWVAKNLGFLCLGIAPESIERVSVNYLLMMNDNKFSIYTEICSKKDFNIDHFNDKQRRFDNLAKQMGWSVVMIIKTLIPHESYFYLKLLLSNHIKSKHEDGLVEKLWGDGLTSIANNIDNGIFTFNDLLKNKKLLLFMILRSIHDPFIAYYPLSNEVAQQLEIEETKIFNNIEDDPCSLFNTLERTSVVKKILKAKLRKLYEESVNRLFNEYRKLSRRI